MKCDIIACGVGGQGVLSVSAILAASALEQGLYVKQSEEHGMAQRGGSVVTHLRLGSEPIHSDLISRGGAELIVSMEPLEGLRYFNFLSTSGTLISSTEPTQNMSGYPDLQQVLERLRAIPGSHLVDAESLARKAGSAKAANLVMVGAASSFIPISAAAIEGAIRNAFKHKGDRVVQVNLVAFREGREAVGCPAV